MACWVSILGLYLFYDKRFINKNTILFQEKWEACSAHRSSGPGKQPLEDTRQPITYTWQPVVSLRQLLCTRHPVIYNAYLTTSCTYSPNYYRQEANEFMCVYFKQPLRHSIVHYMETLTMKISYLWTTIRGKKASTINTVNIWKSFWVQSKH